MECNFFYEVVEWNVVVVGCCIICGKCMVGFVGIIVGIFIIVVFNKYRICICYFMGEFICICGSEN